jgi:hypothetical protein
VKIRVNLWLNSLRKFLVRSVLVVAIAAGMAMAWIFGGRYLSESVDRFKQIEESSNPVASMSYNGRGSGGTLYINELSLELLFSDPHKNPPNVGTTKDDRVALSFEGKVFPFGLLRAETAPATPDLVTEPEPGDEASITILHSTLSWPTPFETNFMSGHSPSRKRHVYYVLRWKKKAGPELQMTWCYEQFFYQDSGWANAFMTKEGSTGLRSLEIRP